MLSTLSKFGRTGLIFAIGNLIELRHRSNPDDPPDVDLIFEQQTVGLEETVLMPPPLGQARAIARDVNPSGGRLIPGISLSWTREELRNLSNPMTVHPRWSNVSDDLEDAFGVLISSIKKKMKEPASQIICVTDGVSFGYPVTEWMSFQLWEAVNGVDFQDFNDRSIILRQRDNETQFFSALLRRQEAIKAKRDGIDTELPATRNF